VAAESPSPFLALDQLRVQFSDTVTIGPVSLGIARGEILALLGPSGSGKTTLLRMLAGFERPDAGRVSIEGEDVTTVPPARRRVGMVFQHYALFPHLDVGENVAFGLAGSGERAELDAKVHAALALVDLAGFERRKVHELSGGQQQRVAVGRALLSRPEIIFADEPTGNLDSRSGAEILTFMRKAVDDLGQTIVMVTHDPNAASYADRVVFLADGAIVDELLEATTDTIIDKMKSLGG
jgi:putative ABC transport system ATP-binding protein